MTGVLGLMRSDSGGLALMFGDGQGSTSGMMPVTRAGTDSGTVVAATRADAAGVTRTSSTPCGELRGADNLVTDRGWLGQVEDQGTGLTYVNARYYDPVLQRFLSPDPLMNPGDPRTLDAYRYAENNPIVFTDATGLRALGQYDYQDGGSYRPVNNGIVKWQPHHSENRPNPQITVLPKFQVKEDSMAADWQPSGLQRWLIQLTRNDLPQPKTITRTEASMLDIMFPPSLAHFKKAYDVSIEYSAARYPEDGNDGHRDAFRHALWSAMLANYTSPEWASEYVAAHEGVVNNPASREAMDLYNDSIGIGIGRDNPFFTEPSVLADQVDRALTSGSLVVIGPDQELYWSDEVCVGCDLDGNPDPVNPFVGEDVSYMGQILRLGG